MREEKAGPHPLRLAEGVVCRVPQVAGVTLALEVAHLVDADVAAGSRSCALVNICNRAQGDIQCLSCSDVASMLDISHLWCDHTP